MGNSNISAFFPMIKTKGYKIGHAYGIGLLKSWRSEGSTCIVAMEFIPLLIGKLRELKWLMKYFTVNLFFYSQYPYTSRSIPVFVSQ